MSWSSDIQRLGQQISEHPPLPPAGADGGGGGGVGEHASGGAVDSGRPQASSNVIAGKTLQFNDSESLLKSLQMLFEGVPAGLRTMGSVLQRLRSGNNNK